MSPMSSYTYDPWNRSPWSTVASPINVGANGAQTPRTAGQYGGFGAEGMFNDTEGRATDLGADPSIRAAQDYLRGVVSGQNVPFSETSMNAMRAQNARGTATAAGSQMGQLRDSVGASGGSIYDPGYQSASREIDSHRQGQNLDYAGQLQAQASRANSQAQMQGAGQLANTTLANNAQINALLSQAAGLHSQQFTTSPAGSIAGYANPGFDWSFAPPPPAAPQPGLTSFQQQARSQPQQPAQNYGSATTYGAGGGGSAPAPAPTSAPAPQQQPQQPSTWQQPASGYGPVQTFGQDSYSYQKPMQTYTTRRTA